MSRICKVERRKEKKYDEERREKKNRETVKANVRGSFYNIRFIPAFLPVSFAPIM